MGDPFTFDKPSGEATTGGPTGSAPLPAESDVTLYRPRALKVGEIIGHYRIEAPLGQGGNGTAYAARNIDDEDERVAIKLIRPDRRDRARLARLLRAEAAALRRVKHDAIVQYRTFKRIPDSDEYYLVTEHIEGPTLSWCLSQRAMNPAEVARLAVRVADALEVAHAQGVIHRDLSPDNIILPQCDPARATLIDFGIAKQGTVDPLGVDFVGKLAFAAPEQFEGDPTRIGPWTDLYSLGLVLAAAARGRRIDMGRDMASATAARRTEPPLDGVHETLRQPIGALLKSDPAARIRSAGAAAALFGGGETLIGRGDETVLAPIAPPTPQPQPRSWTIRSLRIAVAAVALSIGAFVLASTTYGIWEAFRTRDEPAEDEVKPGGEVPAGGSPGQVAAMPAPESLSTAVAEQTATARASSAAAIFAEARARAATVLSVSAVARAEDMVRRAEEAAQKGRDAADLACRGASPDYDCIDYPDGRKEAGQRHCYDNACAWTGHVVLVRLNGESFEGKVDAGRPVMGILKVEDGSTFAGGFSGGTLNGPGRFMLADGTATLGDFANGLAEGNGAVTYSDDGSGRIAYRGSFEKGLRSGSGTIGWRDGTVISGDFALDQVTGFAVETNETRRIEGEMREWFMLAGVVRYADGRRYEGSLGYIEQSGAKVLVRSGYGVLYAADGRIEEHGRWESDRLVGP